jgi:hypothetical protein
MLRSGDGPRRAMKREADHRDIVGFSGSAGQRVRARALLLTPLTPLTR